MATDPMLPLGGRTHLAAAGARAATEAALAGGRRADRISGLVFLSLLLMGVSVALLALAAILLWSLIEGAPRLDVALLANGPSTLRPETAGYRTSILGTLFVVGGVIVLIVPLGVGRRCTWRSMPTASAGGTG